MKMKTNVTSQMCFESIMINNKIEGPSTCDKILK